MVSHTFHVQSYKWLAPNKEVQIAIFERPPILEWSELPSFKSLDIMKKTWTVDLKLLENPFPRNWSTRKPGQQIASGTVVQPNPSRFQGQDMSIRHFFWSYSISFMIYNDPHFFLSLKIWDPKRTSKSCGSKHIRQERKRLFNGKRPSVLRPLGVGPVVWWGLKSYVFYTWPTLQVNNLDTFFLIYVLFVWYKFD